MSGNAIADSSAVSLPRVLPHQQDALSQLHAILQNYHSNDPFDWLDLACGRGQIITHLNDTLPDPEERAKICYFGYDINNQYAGEAVALGKKFGLKGADVKIGNLNDFAALVSLEQQFSFITFTNAAHEITPVLLGTLFFELILRLKPGGTIYFYDMESLPDQELGAIPWQATEIRRLLNFIFKELGAKNKPPSPQRWQLTKCHTWSFSFKRENLDVDDATFAALVPELKTKTDTFIKQLFKEKLDRTVEQLQDLMEHRGTETTPAEHAEKLNLLYDYWSLSQIFK